VAALLLVLATGVGVFLSALTVKYRDVRHALPFVMQFWMLASPVLYPPSLFPARHQWLLLLNPMTGLLEAFRSASLDRPLGGLLAAVTLGAVALAAVVGLLYFRHVERQFADII